MSKSFKKDLTGQRFGRLTVLEFVPNESSYSYWLCKCDCGNTKIIESYNLRSGHTTSCGCFHSERTSKVHKTHGGTDSRLFRIYRKMKDRCLNPNSNRYKIYGGRGIKICEEWLNDFIVFRDWSLSHGYTDDLSIDRIDSNGNYEPSNCRWVTSKQQARNIKTNLFVNYKGKQITLAEAAELTGINYGSLWDRYLRGDRGERLFRPVKK